MSKLLIITNADDFGLSNDVNAEVERLHQCGVLSSATIMANGLAVEELKGIHDRNPRLGIGVHLNATNFRALTPAMRSSVLCNESGSFVSNFRASRILSLTRILSEEWLAQVNLLRKLGISLDHLDSHHHVHTWPPALLALRRVSRISGIPWVRNTRNCVSVAERVGLKSKLKYSGKGLWSFSARSFGMRLTHGFCSVLDYKQILIEGGSELQGLQSLELMCHPGDSSNSEFVEECHWLEHEFPETLGPDRVLVGYKDLM